VQYCKRKKNRFSCTTGVRWDRCFRIVSACVFVDYDGGVGGRCVFRAADGKLATLRTGSTVMRCLGGRNIDPVGPQRTSCATLQRLTTKNPSSKKKKNHLGVYPTKCTTTVMAAGVTSSHIKDGNPSNDDQDEYSCLLVLLFLFSQLRTNGPKSVGDNFPPHPFFLRFIWVGPRRVGWYRVI